MSFQMLETESLGTVIKVIGVGGAGGNAVQHMIRRKVAGVEFICANTDAQSLAKADGLHALQLGASGLGAGAKPEAGKAAAEADRGRIAEALRGAHMVFITAGMGGGTGTGAAPVVAEVAKELGALTVAVVTKPFSFEGGRRMKAAEAGLSDLEDKVDSLIVILNEKLEEVLGDEVTQREAFAAADDVLHNAVAGIAEIINVEGMVNVDFEDVKTVMGEQGKAMMGTATACGPDRARIAAEQAVRSPLLEGVDLSGARGILVNITASSSLKLKETKIAMETIRTFAAEDATIIFGTVYDEEMADEMRVTVVATGLGTSRRRPSLVRSTLAAPVQRTGTDDAVGAPVYQGREPESAPGGNAYQDYDRPAIWRQPAKSEAAARVIALEEGGMDRFDIPAFLRKQAD
ncbi:MAG: cell division protein FtsZ [Proteobacteria bacterium]|nr:cell division protein FtsZ [Pseudomonadota bacterium]MDA0846710.1 cell division protein FtsZ [Pseudomonadota bacterium]